ncbi:MAG TPA: hypothetical protein VIA81_02965, partial [Acidimicrobiia bacterium]
MERATPRVPGAGGTPGGVGPFLLGVAITIAGGYLLLNSLRVLHGFGGTLFPIGGFNVTGGMVL